MNDLVEFLKARLDEDEAAARRAIDSDEPFFVEANDDVMPLLFNDAGEFVLGQRMLLDIAAKRQLLQEVWTGMEDFATNIEESRDGGDCGAREYRDQLLGILALPYSDHPDYQEAWRV